MSKLSNHIEALLFLSGEPLKIERIVKILNKEERDVLLAIEELSQNLEKRGVHILNKDNKIMLGTAPESSVYCEELLKEELDKNLGKAGLETLAIILYKGSFSEKGVSRSEIDYIRGVNSAFTLRALLVRGLIERGVNPRNKRGYVYTPSIQAMQYLGIAKKEDLPNFEEFIKQMENAIQYSENN
ncbi:MAG: SMC-Scp complex subunit ScpB [Patescibacteria group bacterium]